MFANMLRPSRRQQHVHERVSQREDEEGGGGGGGAGGGPASGPGGSGPTTQGGGVDGDSAAVAAEGGSDGTTNPASGIGVGGGGGGGVASGGAAGSSSASSDDGGDDDDDDVLLIDDDGLRVLPPGYPASMDPFLAGPADLAAARRRRQSTCTVLILFFLSRIWIEAIVERDAGLLFLSAAATAWTYRWVAAGRDGEEGAEGGEGGEGEGVRADSLRAEDDGGGATGGGRGGSDAAVDFDPDLGLMSFQAQMALAILESQRQMFENGGYGGNDGATDDEPGVTDEAKRSWKSYEWGECPQETAELSGVISRTSSSTNIARTGSGGGAGDYGSVGTADDDEDLERQQRQPPQQPATTTMQHSPSSSGLDGGPLRPKTLDDEEPSCSICLCEYEAGERVVRLPCDHFFHEGCLSSWTTNHVRCPLCNADLMEGHEQPEYVRESRRMAEERRAFRTVALSTLGRRWRTRGGRRVRAGGTTTGGGTRTARATVAAAMAAAAEDSIV